MIKVKKDTRTRKVYRIIDCEKSTVAFIPMELFEIGGNFLHNLEKIEDNYSRIMTPRNYRRIESNISRSSAGGDLLRTIPIIGYTRNPDLSMCLTRRRWPTIDLDEKARIIEARVRIAHYLETTLGKNIPIEANCARLLGIGKSYNATNSYNCFNEKEFRAWFSTYEYATKADPGPFELNAQLQREGICEGFTHGGPLTAADYADRLKFINLDLVDNKLSDDEPMDIDDVMDLFAEDEPDD